MGQKILPKPNRRHVYTQPRTFCHVDSSDTLWNVISVRTIFRILFSGEHVNRPDFLLGVTAWFSQGDARQLHHSMSFLTLAPRIIDTSKPTPSAARLQKRDRLFRLQASTNLFEMLPSDRVLGRGIAGGRCLTDILSLPYPVRIEQKINSL